MSAFPSRRLVPAVYAQHTPSLKRLVGVTKINDRIYVHWRLPMKIGAAVATRRRRDTK